VPQYSAGREQESQATPSRRNTSEASTDTPRTLGTPRTPPGGARDSNDQRGSWSQAPPTLHGISAEEPAADVVLRRQAATTVRELEAAVCDVSFLAMVGHGALAGGYARAAEGGSAAFQTDATTSSTREARAAGGMFPPNAAKALGNPLTSGDREGPPDGCVRGRG
jgi:hypothetical protein